MGRGKGGRGGEVGDGGRRVRVGRGGENGRHRIQSRFQAPSCQHRAPHGAQIPEP